VELRDNRLDFLIYRPISAEEANAVLAKACEQMQPLSAEDAAESSAEADASSEGPSAVSVGADAAELSHHDPPVGFREADAAQGDYDGEIASDEDTSDEDEEESQEHSHAIGFRGACAAVLVVAAVFACGDRAMPSSICRGRRKGDSAFCGNRLRRFFMRTQRGRCLSDPPRAMRSRMRTSAEIQFQFQRADAGVGSGCNGIHAGSAHALTKGSRLPAASAGV